MKTTTSAKSQAKKERTAQRLNLSEAQQVQFEAVMEDMHEQKQAIFDRTDDREQAKAARKTARDNKTEFDDSIDDRINKVYHMGMACAINKAMPFKALQRIKRYMRRQCRKPVDMSVREYSSTLQHMNSVES